MLELLKPRAKRLDDFVDQGRFFFADAVEYDAAAVEKHLRASGMAEHLVALDAAFAELETFDAVSTETALRAVADARGVKAATLIHAVRVAVTGKTEARVCSRCSRCSAATGCARMRRPPRLISVRVA